MTCTTPNNKKTLTSKIDKLKALKFPFGLSLGWVGKVACGSAKGLCNFLGTGKRYDWE
jgi:hypothetical protein